MLSLENLAWLQVADVDGIRLVDTGRISALLNSLKDPAHQHPSFLLFVGQHGKSLALRELFPANSFRAVSSSGVANLRVDNASTSSNYPIFFAESNLSQTVSLTNRELRGAETFSIEWAKDMSPQQLSDVLHSRLLCPFVDVICIFADDFESFDRVVQLLLSWATAAPEVSSHTTKPRVVIVRRGDEPSPSSTYDLLELEGLGPSLNQEPLRNLFSSVKILHLAAEQISLMSRFRRLKELLWTELDKTRALRQQLGCLYSARHVNRFFQLAVVHTAESLDQPFSFIAASRQENRVNKDCVQYFTRFLKAVDMHKIAPHLSLRVIALSIFLDAYPPKMHCECTRALFPDLR